MKGHILAIAASLATCASAFPKLDAAQLNTHQGHVKKNTDGCPFAQSQQTRDAKPSPECPFAAGKDKTKRQRQFDASRQRIDVDGEHKFEPPSSGDERGPCPGLNALANHGYLPRTGVADMLTIIQAVNEVYGMSLDLGGFLAVYGTVFNGNPLSTNPGYSIGGPSRFSQNILGGLGILGTPMGLSGSHNNYETDVSPTRGDLYVTGNNFHVQLDRFEEYWNAIPENTPAPEQYTALAPFHSKRFSDSVSTNSHFFFSPFAGVLVSPAGFAFPVRMMANHSDEFPEGHLSREVFTTFFGVEGDKPGNFEVKQGWERIPDNWYRRPAGDDYSIPDFLLDVVEHAAYDPRLLSIGGNTGSPNSFTGVDVSDLTGGAFNFARLADPDNLFCFTTQIIQAAAPDQLGSMFSDVGRAMAPLTDKLQQLLSGKTCPQLQRVNWDLLHQFPGYTDSYPGYDGRQRNVLSGVVDLVGGAVGGLIPTRLRPGGGKR